MKWITKLQYLLFALGLVMLAVYFGARVHRSVYSRAALDTFKAEQAKLADQLKPTDRPASVDLVARKPDFSLWSPKRVKEYEDSLSLHTAPAIAILRIPKLRLEVPVLEGTDDMALNRGVGRIEGTAQPGEDGNVGIAGHRDGFFRGLKDIGSGDTMELVTRERTVNYTVDRVVIVNTDDVSVLAPRQQPSITLVTCYPFYFIGSAPKRYIVQASISGSDRASPKAVETASGKNIPSQ